MDTTEQKLAQALQREVHLQYTLESERRANESLRAQCEMLQGELDFFVDIAGSRREQIVSRTAELTIAKQDTANALHKLRSAVAVIEAVAAATNVPEAIAACKRAYAWLTLHAQQTKAPGIDPDSALPTFASLRGLAAQGKQEEVSEETVRKIRHAWDDPEAEAEQAKEAMLIEEK